MGDNDVESALAESPAIVTHATQAGTTIDSHHSYPITPAANGAPINSPILLNNSPLNNNLGRGGDYNCSSTGPPKPACTLRPSLVNGTLLHSLPQKAWRLCRSIGKAFLHFDRDLHSFVKDCPVHYKPLLTLVLQPVNVLEKLHDNVAIMTCFNMRSSEYKEENFDERQQTADSGNSSEQKANDDDNEDFVLNRRVSNTNASCKNENNLQVEGVIDTIENFDRYTYSPVSCRSPSASLTGTRTSERHDLLNSDERNHDELLSTEFSSRISKMLYKCNRCDYFSQTHTFMTQHYASSHPQCEKDDYIVIPTNPMAIHAFQAAMAAATLAAVSRSSKDTKSPSRLHGYDCPSLSQTSTLGSVRVEKYDDLEPFRIKQEVSADTLSALAVAQEGLNEMSHLRKKVEPKQVVTTVGETCCSPKTKRQNLSVQCPLCQDFFTEKQLLEVHLMTVHNVSSGGLARLLQLVDNSIWQNIKTSSNYVTTEPALDPSIKNQNGQQQLHRHSLPTYDHLQCQQCETMFKHEQELLQHAQKMQHYNMKQGEYLCLASNSQRNRCSMQFATLTAMFTHYNDNHMSLVISERHVYKYRCKQCSLAFKTQDKLATHALYHTMRDATKCGTCQRNFRSAQALQKHIEQFHNQTIANSLVASMNVSDCSSPGTVSPAGSEVERCANINDKLLSEQNARTPPLGPDECSASLSPSSLKADQAVHSPTSQQQHIAAITTALLKQQQPATGLLHHLQEQQQQQLSHIPALSNFQQIQHQLPQLVAASAASGMPFNAVEMLNFMQFHHLMSLNFMNLAPPLVFGGNPATVSSSTNTNNTRPSTAHTSSSNPTSAHLPSTDLSVVSSNNISTAISTSIPAVVPAVCNTDVGPQLLHQPQQISPGLSSTQLSNNQKRARTRITDEQLKILRAHFDINNSPSEESIMEMSQKANLPMKVVKHWFRNTLFKERQRNKDSPYNFNNPPSTTLNLEEYERTGNAKVVLLNEQNNLRNEQQQQARSPPISVAILNHNSNDMQAAQHQQQHNEQKYTDDLDTMSNTQVSSAGNTTFEADVSIKTEHRKELNLSISMDCSNNDIQQQQAFVPSSATVNTFFNQQHQKVGCPIMEHNLNDMNDTTVASSTTTIQHQQYSATTYFGSYEAKSESGSSDMHSRPQTPNRSSTPNIYNSMNELLGQHIDTLPLNQMPCLPGSSMGPPKKFQLNSANTSSVNNALSLIERPSHQNSSSNNSGANSSSGVNPVSTKAFEKHSPSHVQFDNNSNSSNSSSTSSGKRANRTRFTDYQIKVLQEFFENNSYPKDSDLEYLSKLLLLSPRVIVVWFQNARQKQRKIYENQPNNSLYESEEKKQNINYACKKCNLVFQRYYELIRHQKNHCFKEENNKKSAKAQIAAAQLAQNLSSEDSNSSADVNNTAMLLAAGGHPSSSTHVQLLPSNFHKSNTASEFGPTPVGNTSSTSSAEYKTSAENQKFDCDKCKLTFTNFEQLREHQLLHLVNPNLNLYASTSQQHPGTDPNTAVAAVAAATYGPFGTILQSLQQVAQVQQQQQHQKTTQPPMKKRKYSETSSNADDASSLDGISLSGNEYESQAKKYNFLYQYFLQNEGSANLRYQITDTQQQSYTQDTEMNLEFLANFYQQTESKKRNSYEFLLHYYLKNEQQQGTNFNQDNKPSLEFLLQYYQLSESKKFFQIDGSPQMTLDVASTPTNNSIQEGYENFTKQKSESTVDDEGNVNFLDEDVNRQSNLFHSLTSQDNVEEEHHQQQNSEQNKVFDNERNNNYSAKSDKQTHGDKVCDKISYESINNKSSWRIEKLDLQRKTSNRNLEHIDQLDGLEEVKPNQKRHRTRDQLSSSSEISASLPITQTAEALAARPSIVVHKQRSITLNNKQQPQYHSNNQKAPITSPNILVSDQEQRPTFDSIVNTTAVKPHLPEYKQSKRLRTTILPEQLNFLYECFQNESNPSRKMLEEIATKINLKKRVVQVSILCFNFKVFLFIMPTTELILEYTNVYKAKIYHLEP
uniref:Zinc finger protein 2 n=1 Tax=Glossina palpalis gambiensis TaxID=67801 RepID=A0A1B0AXW7_9MUSC